MLIIPFDRQIDWRRPPVVTLLLIALNVIAYALWQSEDNEHYRAAFAYYFESELPTLELPHYLAYQREKSAEVHATEGQTTASAKELPPLLHPLLLQEMQADTPFMERLRAGQIIRPDDAAYPGWQTQRRNFENKLNTAVFYRYGLRTGEVEIINLVAHFFLHASWGHLIGNMLFLLAVGFIVEAVLGSWTYGLCYVVLGLSAAAFTIALRPDGLLPSIGASGAIAGVMGMYAVLFGFKKVSFFYFIGVYFGYLKAPAWLLLALWLGYEIYQQWAFSEFSNINYFVHIGGFVSGALMALVCKYAGLADSGYIEQQDQTAAVQAKLAKAQAYLADLEFTKAKVVFKELLYELPERREVLYGLYRSTQIEPASADYHDSCRRIFELTDLDPATGRLIADTLRHYLHKAQPEPCLKPALIERLTERTLNDQYLEQAQHLIRIMLKNPADHPKLPHYLLRISQFYRMQNDTEQARYYQNVLLTEFADSAAARTWLNS